MRKLVIIGLLVVILGGTLGAAAAGSYSNFIPLPSVRMGSLGGGGFSSGGFSGGK